MITSQWQLGSEDVVDVPQGFHPRRLPDHDRKHRHPGVSHPWRVGAGCQDDRHLDAPGRQQEGGREAEKSEQEDGVSARLWVWVFLCLFEKNAKFFFTCFYQLMFNCFNIFVGFKLINILWF